MTADLKARLATLQVEHNGTTLATLQATIVSATGDREPTAVLRRPGVVHLGWDHVRYPKVIVKDPVTGHNLALAASGSLDLMTGLRELELLLSDGLHTVTRRIPVTD